VRFASARQYPNSIVLMTPLSLLETLWALVNSLQLWSKLGLERMLAIAV